MPTLSGIAARVKHYEEWVPPVAGVALGASIVTGVNDKLDSQIDANVKDAHAAHNYKLLVRGAEAVAGILVMAATAGKRSGWGTFGLTLGASVTFTAGSELVTGLWG